MGHMICGAANGAELIGVVLLWSPQWQLRVSGLTDTRGS